MAQYFEIVGAPRAMRVLRDFSSRAEHFEEVAPDIHKFLLKHMVKVFETEGQAGGVKWPQYAGNDEIYGLIKARQLHPDKPKLLRWHPKKERLYPSLTEDNHPEHVFTVEGKSIKFGTRVPYAWRHQHGKGVGPYGEAIPKREFMVLGPRGVAEIRRIISQHMRVRHGADI